MKSYRFKYTWNEKKTHRMYQLPFTKNKFYCSVMDVNAKRLSKCQDTISKCMFIPQMRKGMFTFQWQWIYCDKSIKYSKHKYRYLLWFLSKKYRQLCRKIISVFRLNSQAVPNLSENASWNLIVMFSFQGFILGCLWYSKRPRLTHFSNISDSNHLNEHLAHRQDILLQLIKIN